MVLVANAMPLFFTHTCCGSTPWIKWWISEAFLFLPLFFSSSNH